MLSVSSYPQDHVDRCRARIDGQLAAYRDLVAACADDAAVAVFAPQFFAHMVLALDQMFLHRARGQEGKDGNALNEVRLLCRSLVDGDGTFAADKAIRMKPATSVLGLEPGDVVTIDEAGFTALAAAFLAAIEQRYP
ncbi:hypothetical protein DSM112329_01480 [Paraconexibacter sp. AEG42_29]|uniref:Uncharacterized protein n=1 Tax=Paraconexibacter sp. AEG42_29 TaxID=2997339 RepID=A0AAU7ASM1_9ACTN